MSDPEIIEVEGIDVAKQAMLVPATDKWLAYAILYGEWSWRQEFREKSKAVAWAKRRKGPTQLFHILLPEVTVPPEVTA